MSNIYQDFIQLQYQVEQFLKNDDIESSLNIIFEFIESNQDYIQSRIPHSRAIGISASSARLKKAFINGFIEWDLTNLIRKNLIQECLDLLESLRRDIEDSKYEKRNYPHIGSIPHLFSVASSLENIENILRPYIKNL